MSCDVLPFIHSTHIYIHIHMATCGPSHKQAPLSLTVLAVRSPVHRGISFRVDVPALDPACLAPGAPPPGTVNGMEKDKKGRLRPRESRHVFDSKSTFFFFFKMKLLFFYIYFLLLSALFLSSYFTVVHISCLTQACFGCIVGDFVVRARNQSVSQMT